MKNYTIDITQNTYAKLQTMASERGKTPSEMLVIAVNLLHIALPKIRDINKKLFTPAPRGSARTGKGNSPHEKQD